MARKIRFPLKMANGTDVRTIEELRANFDLASVLGYYADENKLVTWLRDRFYDSEADKIEALDKDSKSFQNDLCAVLGVEISSDSDEADGGCDLDYINRRNEKKRLLRNITDDERVIYNVDSVALDQDDLLDIYDEGKKEIYLCQGEFEIPLSVTNVTYIGINDPVITVRVTDNVNFKEKNIKFVDCVYGWDISNTSPLDNMKRAEHLFLKGDYQKAAGILENYAEQGNPRAVALLCQIYKELLPDNDKLKYWSEKAKQSREVCNVIDNFGGSEKCFALLKKLADKGDAFNEYYYARALHIYGKYHYEQKNAEKMIEFYRSFAKEMVKYYNSSAEKGNVMAMCVLGDCYCGDNVYEEDYKKSYEWYCKAAECGDTEAQYMLTEVANKLDEDEIDIEKILMWLKEAAERGHAKAQYMMGECYSAGNFGEEDYEQAVQWYTKAAKQGYVEAQLKLAKMYEDGYDIEEDYEKAFEWYSKAARLGNAEAQYDLGLCYYNGDGTEQNYTKAFEWFTKSAEQGNREAEYNLGLYYLNDEITEQTEQNCITAAKWFEKAVEHGQYKASFDLFYSYAEWIEKAADSNGGFRACLKLMEQNYDKAFELCTRSLGPVQMDFYSFSSYIEEGAMGGDPAKQYKLGKCYELGMGTDRDKAAAFEWYTKAAENGNVDAQYSLGTLLYHDGNTEKAIEWLNKASESGHSKATGYLVEIYEKEGDIKSAIKYYERAIKNGDTYAINYLVKIYQERNNIEKVVECYTKAFEAGDTRAAFKLGRLYEDENNIEKAIKWFGNAREMSALRRVILNSGNHVTN